MLTRTAASFCKLLATQFPVVVVTGPRQSGKTTLCRSAFPDKPYVSLERPDLRALARDDPLNFIANFPDGAIIDEFQRVPEFTSWLQGEVDADARPGRFILTGSEQIEVMNRVGQSLAGRVGLLRLLPFSLEEMAGAFALKSASRLIHRGFYPRVHDRKLDPANAYADYFATYIQRDLRTVANVGDLSLFERFTRACATRCGQILNLSNISADIGVSHTTARQWLSVLEAGYIVRLLPPYHWNSSKRLIKAPKLYFYDVGLAAYLLGILEEGHVNAHPLRGALFENLVVMEALKWFWHRGQRAGLSFYRDSNGNEVDLLIELVNGIFPIEIKAGQTVNTDYFKGLRNFAKLYETPPPNGGAIVYGGDESGIRYDTTVMPPAGLATFLSRLTGAAAP